MHLDERSEMILNDIAAGVRHNSKEIQAKYEISLRQFMYSISKINAYLRGQKITPIVKKRSGELIVSDDLKELLDKCSGKINLKDYIPSESERVELLMLMIITMEEDLSLQHFVSELQVSKNTILSDLKIVKEKLSIHKLELKYTRLKGYFIKGKEFEIRKLLIELVNQILNISFGRYMIGHITHITNEEVEKFRDWLETIEEELRIVYTDDKMETTPYALALVYRRIENGYYLQADEMLCQELSDTKEYAFAERLLSSIGEVPKQERFFITLQLLSTSLVGEMVLSEAKMIEIQSAVEEVVSRFENRACIVFQDREHLIQMLVQHMKPAYYRIKYNLTLTGNLLDLVNVEMYENELQEIHLLLQQCMKPMEELIGSKIPEIELKFITMFVASWFRKEGQKLVEKPRALVVCPNGITVSKVMHTSLKELFPEFIFLDTTSVREFETRNENTYDIVFSPVSLKTKKLVFMVDPVITIHDKKTLRKKVLEEIYGIKTVEYDVEEVMDIVKKYIEMEKCINVKQEKMLKRELKRYFSVDIDDSSSKEEMSEDVNITDLLSADYIQQNEKVRDWREAMRVVAQPLLDKQNVTTEYVNKVISQYNDESIYIIFGGKIAVPHGMPKFGVKKLGMSMLVLDKPVRFGGLDVHVFIMLAPIDEKKHLKAMLQMTNLAADEKGIKKLVEAKSEKEIIDILRKYQS
ncbi:MAG: BglG family transcription antiterminator [Anaerostipes sp.]|jgi:transcriptional antiterminator/mannitol/fructose-specific phosphotransferase system IIA component (Ntr-type)